MSAVHDRFKAYTGCSIYGCNLCLTFPKQTAPACTQNRRELILFTEGFRNALYTAFQFFPGQEIKKSAAGYSPRTGCILKSTLSTAVLRWAAWKDSVVCVSSPNPSKLSNRYRFRSGSSFFSKVSPRSSFAQVQRAFLSVSIVLFFKNRHFSAGIPISAHRFPMASAWRAVMIRRSQASIGSCCGRITGFSKKVSPSESCPQKLLRVQEETPAPTIPMHRIRYPIHKSPWM